VEGCANTIHSKIAKRRARRSLNFDIGALKKRKDGFQRVPINFAYIWGYRTE
jgi:hypothetical protein